MDFNDGTFAARYLADFEEELRGYPSAVNRARAVHEEIATMGKVFGDLGRLRREAILQARGQASVQQIADALGITRARVYQIVNE